MYINNSMYILKLETVYKFSILLFFIVVSNATLSNSQPIWWGSFGCICISLILFITSNKFRINKYIIWITIFNFVLIASILWSTEPKYSMDIIKGAIVKGTVLCFISILTYNKRNLFIVLKLFLIASLINSVYILYNIDFTTIGIIRIGAGSLGEEWNSNIIGMLMAFSTYISYFLSINEINKRSRVKYYICILIFTFIVLFSGSRKALMILIISNMSFYFLYKKNKFYSIFKISIICFLVYYLIMNIPELYYIVGRRIESLLAQFTGNGFVDNSTQVRMSMIEYGVYWFQKKPILGYGIDNYKYLYANMVGDYMYSHNNYIELLVGTGVIGILSYYSMYIYIFMKSISKKNIFSIFVMVAIITLSITEVGLVSYSLFYIQFLICISYSILDEVKDEFKIIRYNDLTKNS